MAYPRTATPPSRRAATRCAPASPAGRRACPERSRRINGRNALTWEQKFALDVWHVDHLSFWLDLRTILLTILKVLARQGSNSRYGVRSSDFSRCLRNRSD